MSFLIQLFDYSLKVLSFSEKLSFGMILTVITKVISLKKEPRIKQKILLGLCILRFSLQIII